MLATDLLLAPTGALGQVILDIVHPIKRGGVGAMPFRGLF